MILIKPLIHQLSHAFANKAINWPIKAISNRSKNPEIMEDQVFEVYNNEIEILLYQSEAEKYIKLLNLWLNKIII